MVDSTYSAAILKELYFYFLWKTNLLLLINHKLHLSFLEIGLNPIILKIIKCL